MMIITFFILCGSLIINPARARTIEDTCNINSTVQLISEDRIARLLGDLSMFIDKKTNKSTIPSNFEASGIVLRPDQRMSYVVFDNTFVIGAFCNQLKSQNSNCTNQLLKWPNQTSFKTDSEFEGITYNPLADTYFVVQETVPSLVNPKEYNSNVFEIRINPENQKIPISIVESCRVPWIFTSTSKGFEGLQFLTHRKSNKHYLLALCEGNNCTTKTTSPDGTLNLGLGRIVVLEKREASGSSRHPLDLKRDMMFDCTISVDPCLWQPVGVIRLPTSLQFLDYSDLETYEYRSSTYVAITSQESSQLWISNIEEIDESPFFRIVSEKFNSIFNYPKQRQNNGPCTLEYCNVEGVTWINGNELILASDVSKASQGGGCKEKDASLHYFSIPELKSDDNCR